MQLLIKPFDQLSNMELYQVLKLRVDVFVVEQECPYPELDNKDQVSDHYFFLDEKTLSACLRTYSRSDTQYSIGRIATHNEYRGQGLARQLINQAITDIKKKKGIESIFMQAQSHLIKYYSTFGFEISSEEYMYDGIPHTDLTLVL